MLEDHQYYVMIEKRIQDILLRLLPILIYTVKVTVLLLMIAMPGALYAEDANEIHLRVFEFSAEFYMPIGRGRLDGLMASDGSDYRIATYWLEPAVFRDSTVFLRYSDFIFDREVVIYWVRGASQPGIFNLSDNPGDPLLPRQNSVEAVVRSAPAILSRIRYQPEDANNSLELANFFQESRDQTKYMYEVLPDETDSNNLSEGTAPDAHILNTLPFGRLYSKETRNDGSIVWQARRALNGQPVVIVTIKPIECIEKDRYIGTFDAQTLGRWELIPYSYRAYWSFNREFSKLSGLENNQENGRVLYDKIESYMNNDRMPGQVCLALNRLLFKTSLMTEDIGCVSQSANAFVTCLCQNDSISTYESLLELARISGQIEKQYPQRAKDLVQPLVEQLVKHTGNEALTGTERIMRSIISNKWFTYGELLLDEIQRQNPEDKGVIERLITRLDSSSLSRRREQADLSELMPSVKKYMEQLDTNPPKGQIDINDVRYILEKGLARYYKDSNSEKMYKIVDNIIKSIRLIVGEGPFCGDKEELVKSIEQFSELYLVVEKYKEPIDTVLATFLALSFYDISTPEDHDLLFSQIHSICLKFQSLMNTMLSERGLDSLVTSEDVEGIFDTYEKVFRKYIDDPLWPTFKFPLTANEEVRLNNRLKLGFEQLKTSLDKMSLMLKYGGPSEELKKKTVYEISRAIQQLIPGTAFLRTPSYSGVSCQYRAGYGFTAVIKGPFFEEGNRPKEKFKAMKYFHLGHRLEDIVEHEANMAEHPQEP
ncbi:MAG: hypothetical protein JW715_13725 [Sedimentisphaerales bacterium]|nr:hypothetical protein [Sedimentisphaerales bacterium]